MRFIINGSNLNGGGGDQVADSICASLESFPQHHFIVVLSSYLNSTAVKIERFSNVTLYRYNYPVQDWKSLITGRDAFLDGLVESEKADMVFTVFAPCKWVPKVPHLAGFALSHLVIPESPFFQSMSFRQRLAWRLRIGVWKYIFRKTDSFYTENPYISERVQKLFPQKHVFTVTNCYNQVFDCPETQVFHRIPDFNGWQILNVGSSAPHKNLSISLEMARYLKTQYWGKISNSAKPNFRFLFTISESEFPPIPDELKEHFYFIGKVDISEVPSLYQQADIVFQPTLLECFTAVYPEAMRMGKPILTTDLEFAHGLCGGAALYYSATDPCSAADQLMKMISDSSLREGLVENGKTQLDKFDNYQTRCEKLIALCEQIAKNDK